MKNKHRSILLFLFFGLQVLGIVVARFHEYRFFSWAPFDELSSYEIESVLAGKKLTDSEIRDRYFIPANGRENRSITHIFRIVEKAEETQPQKAKVSVRYSTNGKAEEIWELKR
ncbi:hypothetical protein [Algoriphagus marincola]|jgi:hypothetical protein|uniref:hypothetical protein n=1 Tax=Algoriphagus marincola TaxID=264027 RepID=UPI000407A7EE|nr:hypothetical protein [Algoriphagus marincola]